MVLSWIVAAALTSIGDSSGDFSFNFKEAIIKFISELRSWKLMVAVAALDDTHSDFAFRISSERKEMSDNTLVVVNNSGFDYSHGTNCANNVSHQFVSDLQTWLNQYEPFAKK